MASIALQQSRMLWPGLSLSRPFLAAIPTLPAFLLPAFEWRLPSLATVLELFPPFLLAVPKKKTSHSRKAMRSANKGLKDKRSTLCVCLPLPSASRTRSQTLFTALAVAPRNSRIISVLNVIHPFAGHGSQSRNKEVAMTVMFRPFFSHGTSTLRVGVAPTYARLRKFPPEP